MSKKKPHQLPKKRAAEAATRASTTEKRVAMSTDLASPSALAALSRALVQQGRVVEATARLRQRARLQPHNTDFIIDVILLLIESNRLKDAANELAAASEKSGWNVRLAMISGRLHFLSGCFQDAISQYQSVLSVVPNHSEARVNLALCTSLSGNTDDAIAILQDILQDDPSDSNAASGLGAMLFSRGNLPEAIRYLRGVVNNIPTHYHARLNLGRALRASQQPWEALKEHAAACELEPHSGEALDELALDWFAIGELAKAISVARSATEVEPKRWLSHVHLGNLLAELNEYHEALLAYKNALRISPKASLAKWNAGLAALTLGQFDLGWKYYEARWDCPEFPSQRYSFNKPQLRSLRQANGQTILVHAEQGLGDSIQFIRFAILLAARCKVCVMLIQPQLEALFQELNSDKLVITTSCDQIEFSYYIPLLSLPGLFEMERYASHLIPYVSVPSKKPISKTKPKRIGFSWAGNAAHVSDSYRSIPLEDTISLIGGKNCEWVGLQKEMSDSDFAHAQMLLDQFPLLLAGQGLKDFRSAALLMSSVDLVISVDTAIAHLAGAMGKEVWILLPFAADFRWMTLRADSPWYPSARLWRCSRRGEWTPLLKEVSRNLDRLLESAD